MVLKRSVKRLEQICKFGSTFANTIAREMSFNELLRSSVNQIPKHCHFDNPCRHIHIKKTTRARKQ